jgi:tetratricopeptide (TPR) repeat protein
MRDGFAVALLALFVSYPLSAQRGAVPQQSTPRGIEGIVRLDGRPAAGVLVFLDFASGQSSSASGAGVVGRTMTDSAGRFKFEQLEQVGRSGGREIFSITAHCPGYKDASQVVDLTFAPRSSINLELYRDTSGNVPNVPPGGPGDSISANQPASPEARAALLQGQELLLQKHDAQGSIESFRKVVKLDPKYAPAYVLLGTACVQTQQWAEALSVFEKASKLEPGNATAFFGIGYTLNQQQDFSGAQKPILRSLELNPNYVEAHYELGRSLWALGKWQEAEPHVRKALELNKEFPLAHVLMGNIYLRKRDAKSALSEFQEYLRLDPEGQYAASTKQMVAKIQKALEPR